MNNGEIFERDINHIYHTHYSALLVSSKLLRSLNCAQIDCAYLTSHGVMVLEIKSSMVGVFNSYEGEQIARLRRSTYFVSFALNKKATLKFIAKKNVNI